MNRYGGFLSGLAVSILLIVGLYAPIVNGSSSAVRVASKTFPESYILAEITAQLLESQGFNVERKTGLGGTLIAFEALQKGSIDIYPEYTGTLSQAVLRKPNMTREQLRTALDSLDLNLEVLLGFNNSYAIAISREIAERRNITRISDLAEHPDLDIGFSLEFLNRGDGWPVLKSAYQLPQSASGIEHALAYRAIESGKLDVTDAYTTDGELDSYDLRLLADDRAFFPGYQAVLLTRKDLPAAVAAVLQSLQGSIDEPTMRALNRRMANENLEPQEIAAQFLRESGLADGESMSALTGSAQRIAGYTLVHLKLTLSALFLACLVAIPLALSLARYSGISRTLLYVTGLIQTVPALALLALLIPLVGLGEAPAIIALFLYSLLPIVRNTLTGIFNVDPLLKEVATGMGLTPSQQLWKVELPLAVPTILAGVKTAAIISIGTATLAAFVGAGGLGEPIITGLTLNDHRLILEGAIPAALLAIAAELLFEAIERASIPAHLRV